MSKNMSKPQTSDGWYQTEKSTLRRIQVFFSAIYRTLRLDYFSMPTAGFKSPISRPQQYFHREPQDRLPTQPQLRNEKLALQYIFAEIQKCLRVSDYFINEQFRLSSADPNVTNLLKQHQEEGLAEL